MSNSLITKNGRAGQIGPFVQFATKRGQLLYSHRHRAQAGFPNYEGHRVTCLPNSKGTFDKNQKDPKTIHFNFMQGQCILIIGRPWKDSRNQTFHTINIGQTWHVVNFDRSNQSMVMTKPTMHGHDGMAKRSAATDPPAYSGSPFSVGIFVTHLSHIHHWQLVEQILR